MPVNKLLPNCSLVSAERLKSDDGMEPEKVFSVKRIDCRLCKNAKVDGREPLTDFPTRFKLTMEPSEPHSTPLHPASESSEHILDWGTLSAVQIQPLNSAMEILIAEAKLHITINKNREILS